MQNPRLAARYAKSLLDLSKEMNKLDGTLADMQLVENVCASSSVFLNMLRSPVIAADKKISIIDAIFGQNLSDLTKRFIHLLIAKGREFFLYEIATTFVTQYNVLSNITTLKLTTAAPIDENMKAQIVAKVAPLMPSGCSVQISTAVDKDLIGGFVVEIEDKLYDASIRKRLADVKAGVVDTSYVSKM
jgi:F-type H+-transporting ATPase subunit delta